MDKLEIFDKDGNVLPIADVIYSFIKDIADKSKKDVEDVYIGVDIGYPKSESIWIYTTESIDNGYDGIDLREFGTSIKTNRK